MIIICLFMWQYPRLHQQHFCTYSFEKSTVSKCSCNFLFGATHRLEYTLSPGTHPLISFMTSASYFFWAFSFPSIIVSASACGNTTLANLISHGDAKKKPGDREIKPWCVPLFLDCNTDSFYCFCKSEETDN